jgi:hypothetical protein
MSSSETKGTIVSIFFMDVQCPVLQYGDKNMLVTTNVQDTRTSEGLVIHILEVN